jgi:hypothetical protein
VRHGASAHEQERKAVYRQDAKNAKENIIKKTPMHESKNHVLRCH